MHIKNWLANVLNFVLYFLKNQLEALIFNIIVDKTYKQRC